MDNKARIQITATDKASAVFGQVSRNMRTLDDNTLRLRQSVIGLAAAYGGLSVMRDVITTQAGFQQSIADLAAITGAGGDELKYLSDQAREMGSTTVFTASQAVEAFKLVASLKPELLGNAEALSKVTHETLILAEAAGSTLPDAANTLGQALNQFDAGAEQSTRFINVLAAGQKYGSSMIDQTSQALVKFGVVAHNIGRLSFEETVAAIEAVAKGGEYASEAGTHLRGVLINLETQSNRNFKPSVVGLTQAFKNLAAAQLSSAEEKTLFGKRNIAAGEILMHNTDTLQWLINKVTDSNVAYEQAAIRVGTLTGDMKMLTSAFQEQQLEIGGVLNPSLRVLVQGFTDVINGEKQTKAEADAARDSAMDLAISVGNLADQFGNLLHGMEVPFKFLGSAIGAAAAQIDALAHGNFRQAMRVGDAWIEDMKKQWMDLTDPKIVHRYEDNARRLVAAMKKQDEAAKNFKPEIPQFLKDGAFPLTTAEIIKFGLANEGAAKSTMGLSKAQLALSNIMKRLKGQFDIQQAARLRSEQVMSASQRALGDQFDKIEARKADARQKALDLLSRHTLTEGEYKKALVAINDEVARQRDEATKTQAAIDKLNASWEHGAKQAMQDYMDSASNVAAQTKKLFSDAFSGMEDALVGFVKNGKLDFKAMADSIINDLIRMEIKAHVVLPLMQALGGGGSGGGILDSLGSGIAKMFGFRDGGAFDGVHAFAGGDVFSSPTAFAYGGGLGVMGEAGPEAILPLKRGSDGRLGVSGGGNIGVNISMPVSIDARGADASVVPRIQQSLHELEARIYKNVPAVVRAAQIKNRVTPNV